MARYNYRLPAGLKRTFRTADGHLHHYRGGQFIPLALISKMYAEETKKTVARTAVKDVTRKATFDLTSKDFWEETHKVFQNDTGEELTIENSALYRLFVRGGHMERGLATLYKNMMKELVEEYRLQVPANRLRETEEGWRVGPKGSSKSRLTGKIYRHVGGQLIVRDGRTIGFSFPDVNRLKGFQWQRLEFENRWWIPAGHYFDGKFYPYWMDEQFKKDAGISSVPRIRGGLDKKAEGKAVRRREALRKKNRETLKRKGVSSFGGHMTKRSRAMKPMQKSWDNVMGPQGEKVEARLGVALDQILETNR